MCSGRSGKSPMNPIHATGLFLYPLKTENQSFSHVFKGYTKKPMAFYTP